MERPINEYKLSFTKLVCLPSQLEIGNDYELKVTGEIHSATLENNDDGTFDLHYKAWLKSVETINDKGKVIKNIASKKWSASQKLRFAIEGKFKDFNITGDMETDYQTKMGKLLLNFDEIYNKYLR